MNESLDLRLYGIIGHPIGHSLSPLMHNTAFDVLGMHCAMQAFDIKPQSLKDALQGFVSLDFGGLNVTIPHKEAIIPLLQEIEDEASIIGAVNTVKFDHNSTTGYNTDAYGFLQTLEPYRSTVDGAQFVLLGAGGAARAVVFVLLKHFRTTRIVVASRSVSRANSLIEHFRGFDHSKLSAFSLDDPQLPRILETPGVIVNATPAGMYPNTGGVPLKEIPFREDHVVVDLIYRPLQTEFLRHAAESGAQTISGLEMFIHQGARAFEIWTGKLMDTVAVRAAIVEHLKRTIPDSS